MANFFEEVRRWQCTGSISSTAVRRRVSVGPVASRLVNAAVGVPEELARIERELTAPGGMFEVTQDTVLGERMDVFANRLPSLRDAVVNSIGFGDAEYLVFTDGEARRTITFSEHERAVASVAAALRDRYGVGPGDRVAILAANCPEWIVTFWATISLGAIAVGLNGWWVGPEIRYGLDDSEPKLLVADAKRLARLEGADPGRPDRRHRGRLRRAVVARPRRARCPTGRSTRTTRP